MTPKKKRQGAKKPDSFVKLEEFVGKLLKIPKEEIEEPRTRRRKKKSN